jgi:septum formation protein
MLILASASPRRSELLTQAGFSFVVHPAHIPEDPYPNEDPISYVTRLARKKAQAVYSEITSIPAAGKVFLPVSGRNVNSMKGTGFSPYVEAPKEGGALAPEGPLWLDLTVLGADTTVTLDNQILGKPEDPADAARMLRLLSGRTHQVITGVAIVTAKGAQVAAEVTTVRFLTLSENEITGYVATGEPMDKAGAYAIQGRAARWIPRVEGCYFNVVGLPIALVSTLLKNCDSSGSPVNSPKC